PHGPESAWPRKDRARIDGFKTGKSLKLDTGIKSSLGYTHVRIGRGHAPLAGGDVGATLQQFARQRRRNRGQLSRIRSAVDSETRGGRAAQGRDGVAKFRALQLNEGQLSLGGLQLRLGARNVQIRGDPAYASIMRQVQ